MQGALDKFRKDGALVEISSEQEDVFKQITGVDVKGLFGKTKDRA